MWPFSSPKLWDIGNHRVKSIKRKSVTRVGRHNISEKVTKFKCVDCERVMDSPDYFEDEDLTCWDVIQE